MTLIDTHCHLNDPRFSADLPEVLDRAAEAGVEAMIVVGWDVGSSRMAVELAEKHDSIYAAVGIHPHDASDVTAEAIRDLRELAAHDRVVAVGETGLDLYRELSPVEDQKEAFVRFMELAVDVERPLIIHSRDADDQVLEILSENRPADLPIVRHCFSGDIGVMEAYIDLDCYLGLAGPVTYPNARTLRKVAAGAPSDRIVVETDAPWLPPQGHRGKRNEPAFVEKIAGKVAEVRGIMPETLAETTTDNARTLYHLPH